MSENKTNTDQQNESDDEFFVNTNRPNLEYQTSSSESEEEEEDEDEGEQ